MDNKLVGFSVVVVSFVMGYFVIALSVHKFQSGRVPAAIRPAYDMTHLRGSNLQTALKERMLAGIQTFKEEKGFGIGFGHFTFALESGEKVLGCRAYQKIKMEFEAEGVAVNGEKPNMTVEGKCEFSSDLSKINPLWIPVARIFGEKPAEGEFKGENLPSQLKFTHIADEWPRQWVLIGMTVQGDKGQIEVTREEVSQILGKPFLINFEN
jgi:hypothetical protein